MFLKGFHDLIKPQWLATLRELKVAGGLSISQLSRRMDVSYMAAKQYCEDLTKLGYLLRTRVPRTVVGRPEILYQLSPTADVLFPQPGNEFLLELLALLKTTAGETAPERLLFQWFQDRRDLWAQRLAPLQDLAEKIESLVELRQKDGLFAVLNDESLGFEEFHNPLAPLFIEYPRAVQMEHRALEHALGSKLSRHEVSSSPGERPPSVVFTAESG